MARLDGKAVIVTGAGKGLGRAYARALAAEGAAVVVNDIDQPGAAEVVQEIESTGGRAEADTASVDSSAGTERMVERCVEAFGRIDAVVNNAGIVRDRTLLKMDEADFDAVVAVHLKGTFNSSRFAARRFREQRSGSIINITSTTGLRGNVGQTNYAAAKAGIIGMTMTWALELERYGIRVNVVVPTAVTDMVKTIPGMEHLDPNNLSDELRDRYLGPPEDVAPLVVFLASDAAQGCNGQVLALGGNRFALWSHPQEVVHEIRKGGWTVDDVEDAYRRLVADRQQTVGLWM
jgi:3-oxoacyl-[acyl-carrier protein] reductase